MVAPRYLLDTNVLSEPLRPRPSAELLRRLKLHRRHIATAAVVWHELRYGLERLPPSKKRAVIEDYLLRLEDSTMPIVEYDRRAANWHARERARLDKLGRPVPFRDAQIAAIASVNDLILVTANVADFEPLTDLAIENWLTPARPAAR